MDERGPQNGLEANAAPEQPGPRRPAAAWALRAAGAGILAAAVAVYFNSLGGDFIFDDHSSIVDNWRIRRLRPVSKFFRASRPAVTVSFALNYRLGRLDPRGYHAANLAVHALAALTLFGIARRTLMSRRLRRRFGAAALPLAAAVALLWAVHPLHTQAVTYIVQRGESMTALAYLLTLYCVIRGASSARRRRWWYAGAVGACAGGMAAKEIMATAPLAVLLYDRTFLAGTFRQALRQRRGLYNALAATWIILVALLWLAPPSVGFGMEEVGPWVYARTQPGVILHYLRLSVWPAPLVFDYQWPQADTVAAFLPPAVILAALLALTGWGLWRRPAAGFLGAWFFLILGPTSSFMPLRNMAFEHRMYLSLAAVVGLLSAGAYLVGRGLLERLVPAPAPRRRAGWALAVGGVVAVAAAWGWLTVRRNRDYRNELVMWQDVVDKRHSPRGYLNLGQAYERQGNIAQAVDHYREAIRIQPDYDQALSNLGGALVKQGQIPEAVEQFKRAIQAQPNCLDAHNNLGVIFLRQHRLAEAEKCFLQALRVNPQYVEARCNLALALSGQNRHTEALGHLARARYYRPHKPEIYCNIGEVLADEGRLDEAIRFYKQALRLHRGYAKAHARLGVALLRSGALPQAEEHFTRALELRPGWAKGHYHLGVVLAAEGRGPQAARCFQRALRLAPRDGESQRQLAWLMATCPDRLVRNGAEAVRLAEAAARADPADPVALDALAAAYAEVRRFDEAVEQAKLAARLAARAGRDDLARQIRARADLYRAKRPFRDRAPLAERLDRLLPGGAATMPASRPAAAGP